MTIPSDQQADWVRRKLEVLQDVIGQLNESVKAANSIEEVTAGLTSGETRTFFDEKTEKFNIIYDAEHDNQENKDNFEAACQEVENLFEDVKSMVQFNWIIQRGRGDKKTQSIEDGIRINLSRGWTGWSSWTGDHAVRQPRVWGSKSRGLDSGIKNQWRTIERSTNQQNGQQSRSINQPNQQTMSSTDDADMMKHMQKDAERKANYDSELLELAKRDEIRKGHREDQKMNFANQAAATAAFMRPVSAKVILWGEDAD